MSDTDLPLPLNELQVRILGCLIEKRATTPDQYPLTLNALRNACNQKTNRYPVSHYESGDIGHELRALEKMQLVRMERSARAERYEHRVQHVFSLKPRDIAVLCPLLLRGPQTLAEIKARSYDVLGLDDLSAVLEVLNRLIQHEPPLVSLIPRQVGQREDRYMHLFCGEPDPELLANAAHSGSTGRNTVDSELLLRIEQLEGEVSELRELVEQLMSDLGAN